MGILLRFLNGLHRPNKPLTIHPAFPVDASGPSSAIIHLFYETLLGVHELLGAPKDMT